MGTGSRNLSLVLASASPQRKAILEQLGIPFRAEPSGVHELTVGDPPKLVVENARLKARAVAGELVLGCDTEVVVGGEVLGQPADRSQAKLMLHRLSGRTHEVHGGIVVREGARESAGHAVTRVRFRLLGPRDIERYLDTGEWEGRAGGYAIQGRGAALVESIEGDFWNVVGLPVAELVRLAPGLFDTPA